MKGDFTMKIMYHAEGTNRKALADAISRITGARKVYKGIPSYAYEIDYFTVDREGNLSFDDRADSEKVENLIAKLDEMGFQAEPAEKPQTMEEVELAVTETEPTSVEAQQQPAAVEGITVSCRGRDSRKTRSRTSRSWWHPRPA